MQIKATTLTNGEMIDLLHRSNVRPSLHRLAVLGYVANRRTHPTADEVYSAMVTDFPRMSRTTVYNSLHALVEAGVLRELDIESQSTRYDLAQQIPHSHFRCTACGKIYDMNLPEGLSGVVDPGFKVSATDLFFTGLCAECTVTELS